MDDVGNAMDLDESFQSRHSYIEVDAHEDDHEHAELKYQALPEDIFSLAIMSIVRDTQQMTSTKENNKLVRSARLCTSLTLVFGNMFMQAFLIYMIREYVELPAVKMVQDEYTDFVVYMYGNNTVLVDGRYLRGAGSYNAALFDGYPVEKKKVVCRIPLSQPHFLGTILLIWTLTCIGDMQKSVDLFKLTITVPDVGDMSYSMRKFVSSGLFSTGTEKVILGLTRDLKFLIGIFICFPRVLIDAGLLWLGCRWLTATPDFEELVLNGIALEFVLLTRELLYRTVVSKRNLIDVAGTSIKTETQMPVTCGTFIGSYGWLVCALTWVWFYISHLQNVLPFYGHDVALVCDGWLESLKLIE
eukprot:TRINITY_DN4308_c0_g2_i1.p1 TRINITY_DN4308_c0_g2~~TRINITY_DN4308_c0_g2_i1.p1  ORF type:complete len:358 (+),score=61.34 TRINITY_DN4308_c0_g2_i1:89-1162(+)